MFYFDWTYYLLIPCLLFSLYATFKVKTTFARFSRVSSGTGYTGAEVSEMLLRNGGIRDVAVQETEGFLSDFYDPTRRRLCLSPEVYRGDSLSALGVAAHETGHAFQHAEKYLPVMLRSSLVPLAGFGSNGGYILFLLGLFARSGFLMDLGILFFSAAVIFYVVTLPVEYNASSRAVALLKSNGVIALDQEKAVKAVLGAAALTYLAAALTAVLQLVRLLILRGERD